MRKPRNHVPYVLCDVQETESDGGLCAAGRRDAAVAVHGRAPEPRRRRRRRRDEGQRRTVLRVSERCCCNTVIIIVHFVNFVNNNNAAALHAVDVLFLRPRPHYRNGLSIYSLFIT